MTIPPETEAQFQRRVVQLLETTGHLVYHTHDSRRSAPGFPDLVAARPGSSALFLELKTDKGKVSTAQQEWIDILRCGPNSAHIVRPRDWDLIVRLATGAR